MIVGNRDVWDSNVDVWRDFRVQIRLHINIVVWEMQGAKTFSYRRWVKIGGYIDELLYYRQKVYTYILIKKCGVVHKKEEIWGTKNSYTLSSHCLLMYDALGI